MRRRSRNGQGIVKIEIWKDVVGYKNYYQVSNLGKVRSVTRDIVSTTGQHRTIKGRVLKLQRHTAQYLTVNLYSEGCSVRKYVHQLVLETFIGPNPPKYECCHNNGDKANNHLGNLRWGSRSENLKDRYKHNHKNPLRKKVKRSDGVIFESVTEAAKITGTARNSIADVCKGRCKSISGYSWEYI